MRWLWLRCRTEALAWGLVGSALFLLATLLAGAVAVTNRDARLPTWMATLLGLLLAVGVFWVLLATIAVGL